MQRGRSVAEEGLHAPSDHGRGFAGAHSEFQPQAMWTACGRCEAGNCRRSGRGTCGDKNGCTDHVKPRFGRLDPRLVAPPPTNLAHVEQAKGGVSSVARNAWSYSDDVRRNWRRPPRQQRGSTAASQRFGWIHDEVVASIGRLIHIRLQSVVCGPLHRHRHPPDAASSTNGPMHVDASHDPDAKFHPECLADAGVAELVGLGNSGRVLRREERRHAQRIVGRRNVALLHPALHAFLGAGVSQAEKSYVDGSPRPRLQRPRRQEQLKLDPVAGHHVADRCGSVLGTFGDQLRSAVADGPRVSHEGLPGRSRRVEHEVRGDQPGMESSTVVVVNIRLRASHGGQRGRD
mmetsp:Transcript_11759/g.31751  ORF Transcript_11759/g.31751 Transcript_11759/m.31751 type:complete len:346 (+) Transcript_11759:493-1530(+)